MMTAFQMPDPQILEVCGKIEQALFVIHGDDSHAVTTRLQIEEAIETAYEIAYSRPRQECIILPWPVRV
jgi:hypothetical protein